jgi:hypothetical protein
MAKYGVRDPIASAIEVIECERFLVASDRCPPRRGADLSLEQFRDRHLDIGFVEADKSSIRVGRIGRSMNLAARVWHSASNG